MSDWRDLDRILSLKEDVRWLESHVRILRAGLQAVIDCPDFSARRSFEMKQIARKFLASSVEAEKEGFEPSMSGFVEESGIVDTFGSGDA